MRLLALALLCAAGCTSAAPATCNGAAQLCERRFDEVVFPGTHDAMSTLEANYGLPNQRYGLPRQLADGVRLLLLDIYEYEGQVQLCHGACALGSRPLVEALGELKRFLAQNPGEVIAIVFESYVTATRASDAFAAAGLAPLLHAQRRDQPWATLRTLVATNRRLVVFTDREGDREPWYHDQWKHTWETPYHFESREQLSCRRDRGDIANPLYTVNHFLTAPTASPQLAETINHNPLLLQRLRQCQAESQRLPNFVAVDYYEIGDLFAAVRALNGLAAGDGGSGD